MMTFIKILIVILSFAIPYAYYVKNARVEITLGTSFMIGVSLLKTDYELRGATYERTDILFCFGPFNISAGWLTKIDAN